MKVVFTQIPAAKILIIESDSELNNRIMNIKTNNSIAKLLLKCLYLNSDHLFFK